MFGRSLRVDVHVVVFITTMSRATMTAMHFLKPMKATFINSRVATLILSFNCLKVLQFRKTVARTKFKSHHSASGPCWSPLHWEVVDEQLFNLETHSTSQVSVNQCQLQHTLISEFNFYAIQLTIRGMESLFSVWLTTSSMLAFPSDNVSVIFLWTLMSKMRISRIILSGP